MLRIIPFIDWFVRWGERVMVKVGAALLTLIVAVISVGVFKRYVLNAPLVWTEELSTFLFIWVSFLGAAVASARKKHILVDLLVNRLGPERRRAAAVALNGLIVVFLILVVIGGVKLQPITATHASVTLNIPKNWYYLPVVLACFYMGVLHLGELLRAAWPRLDRA